MQSQNNGMVIMVTYIHSGLIRIKIFTYIDYILQKDITLNYCIMYYKKRKTCFTWVLCIVSGYDRAEKNLLQPDRK